LENEIDSLENEENPLEALDKEIENLENDTNENEDEALEQLDKELE
jgi:hypothetical protein